jgi:LCCL domain-containing protein
MVTDLTRAGFTVILAGIAAALVASCSSEPAGTPIQWSDSVGPLENQQPGQMHRLQCPPNGTVGAAYGHDIYTADTSLCTAAAHSGVITVERGGSFTVEILPAQRFFGASVRNNITTTAYGNYRQAFRVVTPNRATGGASATVPILWETSGGFTNPNDREPYKVSCPVGGNPGTVFGHDAYTADSSVCTAAVHAGAISLERGGEVSVFSAPGRRVYGASTRNGVSSEPYGVWRASFTIGSASPVSENTFPLRWESSGRVIPPDLTVSVECPASGRAGSVWGSDVYTADSSVCTAAVHAGVITLERGGPVRLEPRGPQPSFAGSERDGISSSSYGQYGGSFSFVK